MSDDLQQRLAAVDLFQGFSKRTLERLMHNGREVKHKPGHEIATEGGTHFAFHLILDGSAKVEVAGTPRPELMPGDYFGEISLVDGKPRSATVTAGDDGLRAFAIASGDFHRLVEKHPEMMQSLLVNLCARIRKSEAAAVGG